MADAPESHAAVIDAFGGPAKFGAAIGIPASHARTMKTRDSIPASHWRRTAIEASARSLGGVTFGKLAEIAARVAERRQESEAQSSC